MLPTVVLRFAQVFLLLTCAGLAHAQTSFGRGCGTYGGPLLELYTPPVIGTNLALHSDSYGFGPLRWYLFGFSNRNGPFGVLPTDLGTLLPGSGGCNLYVSIDMAVIGPFMTWGSHALVLQIPNNSALVNMRFFSQVLTIGEATVPLRLQTGNALDITIR